MLAVNKRDISSQYIGQIEKGNLSAFYMTIRKQLEKAVEYGIMVKDRRRKDGNRI